MELIVRQITATKYGVYINCSDGFVRVLHMGFPDQASAEKYARDYMVENSSN